MGSASGGSRGLSACWWGNGPPRLRRVAGLRGRPATLGLRHGPDSYGRQQWGILRNGESLTQQRRLRDAGLRVVNLFQAGTIVTVPAEEAPANYVPAAAVIRRERALSGFIGRKELVGGLSKSGVKSSGSTWGRHLILLWLEPGRGARNSWCSGEMRRYQEEHRWRRRCAGPELTLRSESVGSEQD